MMLSNAEKPDFTNARAVSVCEKMTTRSDRNQKKPYLMGFLGKPGMEWIFLDFAGVNFIKIIDIVR